MLDGTVSLNPSFDSTTCVEGAHLPGIARTMNWPQPCLDPPKSKWHDGQRRINEAGKCIREKYSLLSDIKRWRPSSGVPRGSVTRIRVRSLRRDDYSCVLIGQRVCWLMT